MIAMQKNQDEIWKYLESISKYEKRHELANQMPRNNKGQFVPKEDSKTKKIEKSQ